MPSVRTRVLVLAAVLFTAVGTSAHAQGGRDWAGSTLDRMTLEEKVGQLFMVQVPGRVAADFEETIERYHVGGVIYFNFNENIPVPLDARRVQDLSNGIQRIARRRRVPVPLLIATDQEGGLVGRVTEPGTVFPGAMALGATRSAGFARQAARATAVELRALGISMNFAPVVDVNVAPANPVIGIRSFGEDPELVSRLGAAQVRGYERAGVAATAKHFPGHGDTAVDSHFGLPIITHDRATLDRVDLAPFRAAIAAGADAVMTAHIVVPALDPSGLPATLSRPILTGLLRAELGFRGLIVTDSLDMSGANVLPPERVPVEAFKAGADVLLNPPDVGLAYRSVLAAVRSGEIAERRVDASVRRILRLKQERGLVRRPLVRPRALRVIGDPAHRALAAGIADRSITVLDDGAGVLPLPAGARLLVTGPPAASPGLLATELADRGVRADAAPASTAPTEAEIAAAVERAGGADAVLVATSNATAGEAQQRLVRALAATGRPLIVAAMRNPYDISALDGVDAYVAAYGARAVNVRALARVLTGQAPPRGLLPVTIPGHFPYGAGLTR